MYWLMIMCVTLSSISISGMMLYGMEGLLGPPDDPVTGRDEVFLGDFNATIGGSSSS